MTSLLTRLVPRREAVPVPMSRLKLLGRHRGQQYGQLDGREYLIGEAVASSPGDLVVDETDVILTVPKVATDPSSGQSMAVGSAYRLGTLVPSGTYDGLVAAKRIRTTSAPRPLDALDILPALAARGPTIFAGAGSRPMSLAGVGSMDPGRGPIRGRALLEWLAARGVHLVVRGDGRLIASATQGGDESVRMLLTLAGRLLVGFASGHPLPCELAHDGREPEAWTMAIPDVAVCEAHADGSVDL